AILSTLIACLPSESKELLHENGIFITTPSSKPSLFNYASFCKVLSINEISQMVANEFKNSNPAITSYRNRLMLEELVKLFMNQISSLKKLTYELDLSMNIPANIPF